MLSKLEIENADSKYVDALNYFYRRKNMSLDDKVQNYEDIAITSIENYIKLKVNIEISSKSVTSDLQSPLKVFGIAFKHNILLTLIRDIMIIVLTFSIVAILYS